MQTESSALATLAWAARGKAVAAKSSRELAESWMLSHGAPERAIRLINKAAVSGGTSSDVLGTGIALGPWSDAMRTASAFYRVLDDGGFTRIPMHRRVGLVTSAPSAGVVAEGVAIPVSTIVLNNVLLSPVKAGGLIVLTDELLLAVDAAGQAAFSRTLQGVLAAAVDAAFVNIVATGATPISSVSPNKDLRAALNAVNLVGLARPYWLAAVDVGKFASTLPTFQPAFAAASATGGELANLPLLVSSGVPSGSLYLIDAAGIAADAAGPEIAVSREADIVMDSAPAASSAAPTAASAVSMFATNSFAVKASAVFGAARLRADAVAVVTGITGTTWAA